MSPRLTGLPVLDAREAEMRRSVIAAITGRRVGNALLVAQVPSPRADRGGWLACANGVAIAFDRIDGRVSQLSADDGLDAAATLDRAEPVLREIEAALGIDLDPVEIVAAPMVDALIVGIAGDDHGGPVHALRLAIPPTLALLPEPAPFAPNLVGRVALAATVTIEGPRIAPHDAADLGTGDCILLGSQPLAAMLTVRGLANIPGALDPAGRRFVCHRTDMMESIDG